MYKVLLIAKRIFSELISSNEILGIYSMHEHGLTVIGPNKFVFQTNGRQSTNKVFPREQVNGFGTTWIKKLNVGQIKNNTFALRIFKKIVLQLPLRILAYESIAA